MKLIGSDIFSLKVDDIDFQIIISKEDFSDYKILQGEIIFNSYQYDDENMNEIEVGRINFYIFNTYSNDEFIYCADAISGDLYYVAYAYNLYASDEDYWGSKMIIDNLYFGIEELTSEEKLFIIELFLKVVNDIFETMGTTIVLFMTKALMLNIKIQDSKILLDNLVRIGFIPIYQDEIDFVFGKNITYL